MQALHRQRDRAFVEMPEGVVRLHQMLLSGCQATVHECPQPCGDQTLRGGFTATPRTAQRATSDTVTRYGVAQIPQSTCEPDSRKRGNSPVTDKDHHPLVPAPPGSLTQNNGGPHGVLARMSSDVLAIVKAKESELEQARFRIGEYEFRGPDYRQILRWAEALDLEPDGVVEALVEARVDVYPAQWRCEYYDGMVWDYDETSSFVETSVMFSCVDGRIQSIVLDFIKLPLEEFDWQDELDLKALALVSDPPSERLPDALPASLRRLVCGGARTAGLDLSSVPRLTELFCESNDLTELDLSVVPGTTRLLCSYNQLTQLDLSVVPGLTKLYCESNELTELDLSVVPGLTKLWCGFNRLHDLNLSGLTELIELDCGVNSLAELDLSSVPALTKLWCWQNELTELDLSGVHHLAALFCENNQLSELDLSAVPKLTKLGCSDNKLTQLDLSSVRELTHLGCEENQLSELDIRPLQNLQYLSVDAHVQIIGTPPAGCGVTLQ